MKTIGDLQQEFIDETETEIVNSQGEPDIEYVQWLENRLCEQINAQQSIGKEKIVPNDTKFIGNVCLSFRHDFGLMPIEDRLKLQFEAKEWIRAINNNLPYAELSVKAESGGGEELPPIDHILNHASEKAGKVERTINEYKKSCKNCKYLYPLIDYYQCQKCDEYLCMWQPQSPAKQNDKAIIEKYEEIIKQLKRKIDDDYNPLFWTELQKLESELVSLQIPDKLSDEQIEKK